jgi:hypothetical protein
VDLETLIVTAFVTLDDGLRAWLGPRRLRQRGPAPTLADSEVVTMEVVGELLGLDRDTAIYGYFRQHHADLFPGMAQIGRTTFARQAANLWVAKQALWEQVIASLAVDPYLSIVDSVPTALCRFGYAPRCRRLAGMAAFGWDASSKTTYYGVRHHLRVSWPGLVTAITVAPANVADQALLPELVEGLTGVVVADRQYWNPALREELGREGVWIEAPFRKRSSDPTPQRSRVLNHIRRRIETTASQLAERYHLKRIWARDPWHLTSRLLRKVLSHSLAVRLNRDQGVPNPLQLRYLLT